MVIKKNTYRESKGPCSSADTLKVLKDAQGVETQAGCRYECDSDLACRAFTWAAPAKCVTIGNTGVAAGNSNELGNCFRKVRDAFDDEASLAIVFRELLSEN
jgi:hypothetical protein